MSVVMGVSANCRDYWLTQSDRDVVCFWSFFLNRELYELNELFADAKETGVVSLLWIVFFKPRIMRIERILCFVSDLGCLLWERVFCPRIARIARIIA